MPFADRVHVFYRLRVKKPGDVPKLVEQHVICAFDRDQISALDLVCSGFRFDNAAELLTTPRLSTTSRGPARLTLSRTRMVR
jgi:hypothetical protein